MKHIILGSDSLDGHYVIIKGNHHHYLKNVRRIRVGEEIKAVIGKRLFLLSVKSVEPQRIVCVIIESGLPKRQCSIQLHVYQSILKSTKMDALVTRISEMGVEEFIPMVTARSVLHGTLGKNRQERWRRIAKEGSKISGFASYMKVADPQSFKSVVSFLHDKQEKVLFFTPSKEACHIRKVVETASEEKIHKMHLLFGPEGGFSEEEAEYLLARTEGIPVSLGFSTFRSETAALIATGFLILYFDTELVKT